LNSFSIESGKTGINQLRGDLHKVQKRLLDYIHLSPGIRYRELLRLTESSNGVLSYHLGELESEKRIAVERKKSVTRYFPINLDTEVSKIIGCIRNPVSRQIIVSLLGMEGCSFNELTVFTNRAPSTVSWHLRRLMDAGILRKGTGGISENQNPSRFYYIINKAAIQEIISKYVESPVDKLVNVYSDLMDELT
jgi:predicted transcriptional regulator